MTYPPPAPNDSQKYYDFFTEPKISNEMDLFMRGGSVANRTFSVGTVLPFPQGSILIQKNTTINSITITNPGYSYPIDTTCDFYLTRKPLPSANYMTKSSSVSNDLVYRDQAVIVTPTESNYVLDAIGIISQGNGFTTTPTVTISGSGGSAVAVADMSCSALGPLTPSYRTTRTYLIPPSVTITPHPKDTNASGAKAVAILDTAVANINNKRVESIFSTGFANQVVYNLFYGAPRLAPGYSAFNPKWTDIGKVTDATVLNQTNVNTWFSLAIDAPPAGGTQATGGLSILLSSTLFGGQNPPGSLVCTGAFLTNQGAGYGTNPNVQIVINPYVNTFPLVGVPSDWIQLTKVEEFGIFLKKKQKT
jgi:hypothetical protein